MTQYRQEIHHSKEDEKSEYHKVFHRIAIGLLLSFSALRCLGEDKRFVGITEGLGEHHHHYGNFHIRAVDTHHRISGLLIVGEEIWHHHLPHILTQHSGYSQNKQGPAIG